MRCKSRRWFRNVSLTRHIAAVPQRAKIDSHGNTSEETSVRILLLANISCISPYIRHSMCGTDLYVLDARHSGAENLRSLIGGPQSRLTSSRTKPSSHQQTIITLPFHSGSKQSLHHSQKDRHRSDKNCIRVQFESLTNDEIYYSTSRIAAASSQMHQPVAYYSHELRRIEHLCATSPSVETMSQNCCAV